MYLTIQQRIIALIAYIDKKIEMQLNYILHHSRFQQLEASWRGLNYLIQQIIQVEREYIKVMVLQLTWIELAKDMMHALEFDQSQLFLKIYHHGFGQPGAQPFGILVGDYTISHCNTHSLNTISVLQVIAKIAASAFSPFITAISPYWLGLNSFTELAPYIDLDRTFQQAEYQLWRTLRQDENSRFLGLLLPKVLMRLPYNRDKAIQYPFSFQEGITDTKHFVWGNPVYIFTAVIAKVFLSTGWFSLICGLNKDVPSDQVTYIDTPVFSIDTGLLSKKFAVDVCLSDQQEKILSNQGFIPVCVNEKSGKIIFYDCASVKKIDTYPSDIQVIENNRLMSLLHHILCMSRFAHYLKVIAREKLGTFSSAKVFEKQLQDWIQGYTAASTNLSYELKLKYPLREAKVQVRELIGKPGTYLCTIYLSPHYQFSHIETSLELKTEIPYMP